MAMRIKYLVAILVLLVAGLLPSPSHAGGVVAVCDEAHLLAALAGGGTVTFACSGVITLTNTITIAADTTIDGSGQEVTISGNDAVRVFTVNPRVMLALNRFTVADGKFANPGGAGIYNAGMLIVSNSTFSANRAMYASGGGIYNIGTAIVRNSIFSGNTARNVGGAILNAASDADSGWLTVNNSIFSDNSAVSGGGIYNSGLFSSVTISNSTFSGNLGSIGIPGGSKGGAIYNTDYGRVRVSNSTFFGNSADHGGSLANRYGGAMTVINSTVQGGSIHNASDSMVTLKNTIVANSSTASNCTGPITDGGGNVSYPDASCPGINADPLLGPLRDNGGPTWTMALGPGSAAMDAGDDAICAADPVSNRDQRGVVRPQGAHCDSGALEQLRKWLPIILVE
jgi:hypothetical protein